MQKCSLYHYITKNGKYKSAVIIQLNKEIGSDLSKVLLIFQVSSSMVTFYIPVREKKKNYIQTRVTKLLRTLNAMKPVLLIITGKVACLSCILHLIYYCFYFWFMNVTIMYIVIIMITKVHSWYLSSLLLKI